MNRNAHCEMRKCVKLVIDYTWLWRVCNINFILCIRFINFSKKATFTNCVQFVCIRIFDLFGQKKRKKKEKEKITIFWRLPLLSSRLNARSVNWFESFFETWILLQICCLLVSITIPCCCINLNTLLLNSMHRSQLLLPYIRRNFLLCVQSQSGVYTLIFYNVSLNTI